MRVFICQFHWRSVYGHLGNLSMIMKELITNSGMSLGRIEWTIDLKLLQNYVILPEHMCWELRTAISVSVPSSLLFVSFFFLFFLRILTDLRGLGFVTFLRIQGCVIEKSKRFDKSERVRGRTHRRVILERLPTMLPSF